MIKASKNDKRHIVEILSNSFYDNHSVNYIIAHRRSKKEIIALMDYSFEKCLLYGNVYLSDDKNACALIIYPQKKHFSIKATWLDIKLIFKSIGLLRIFKALNRESAIKTLQPKVDMSYLWFIGVLPSAQHTGIGSKLLTEIIEEADSKELPIYLETSALRNLPWYERFGFMVYNRLELSYTLFFLKREPGI
jgi:GNAT superfamily N-acetyltransferase